MESPGLPGAGGDVVDGVFDGGVGGIGAAEPDPDPEEGLWRMVAAIDAAKAGSAPRLIAISSFSMAETDCHVLRV